MADARYSYNRVRAVIDIAGVRIPIINAIADFELNGIPRCAVSLAVGRSTNTGDAAVIHQAGIAAALRELVPAQIYCQIDEVVSDASVRSLVPDGEFLFFDGLVAGMSPSFSGAADVTLVLTHWLALLNEGSAFSRSTHPASPYDYSFGAIMPAGGSGATGGGFKHELRNMTDISQPTEIVTTAAVSADLWGKAILPWFKSLADRDSFVINERNVAVLDIKGRVNAALNRMSPKSLYGRPLAVAIPPDIELAASIAADIANSSQNPAFYGNQTFWNVLVGNFVPNYSFAVIARPSDTLVVPYIAGYAGPSKPTAKGKIDYVPVIRSGEYNSCRLHVENNRTLRAMGIRSRTVSTTGGEFTHGKLGIGGFYDSKRNGLIQIADGPGWMTQLIVPVSPDSAGAGGEIKSTAMRPKVALSSAKAKQLRGRAAAVVKPLLDAYAKARYANEVFRSRQIPIAGPFRWDIAPGSLVAIEGSGELFLPGDAFDTTYIGSVARATFSISCDPAEAGAGFHVVSVRFTDENADSAIAIKSHPFYRDTFAGAPMEG